MQEITLVAQDAEGNTVLLTAYQEEQLNKMLGVNSGTEKGSATSQWEVSIPEQSPYDD